MIDNCTHQSRYGVTDWIIFRERLGLAKLYIDPDIDANSLIIDGNIPVRRDGVKK